MKIGVVARGRVPPRIAERLAEGFDLRAEDLADPALVQAMVNASAAPLTGAEMDRWPGLRIISGLGVGYDMIDVGAAMARGIVVTHTPGVLDADVANYALLLLLAASRDLPRQDAHVRSGAWAREGPTPLTRTIEGATVGIVGLGRIGRTLAAKLASAFGITVLYHGRSPQDVPYEHCPNLVDMARRSDALVVLLPGGEGTRRLIGAEVLDALGPEGIFVNVARGSVADQPALVAALREGRLGRAALDVFEDEPNVPEELRALPNVLLSPHAASATEETRRAMFDLTADNLIAWFGTGRALTSVPECRGMPGA